MMVSTRHHQPREVRGPQPNSVALIARPVNKHPPDKLLIERRIKEDQLVAAAEIDKFNKIALLRNDWEKCSDRKAQATAIRRKVQSLLRENELTIDARRERLREQLEMEQQAYMEEMASKQETVIERQSKLRERAKELRDKREAERQAIVELKLEQQFRNQCEELRSLSSKRQRDDVLAERQDQMRMKEEVERRRQADEELYAKLWYADIDAKNKREEEISKRQLSANKENVVFLHQQMAELEGKKQEERKLVEEEARLMKEESELQELQKQQDLEEKRRKQQEMREMYTTNIQLKKAAEAREMQQQLAFDLKLLEQLLEESKTEALESAEKKKGLREEDRRYREYLKRMKEEERIRELEMERICDVEVEKMWAKRIQQWKVEKMARQKLLEEVMASRKQQLQFKLEQNLIQQREAKKDREDLAASIENNKRLEREEIAKHHQQNANYKKDLVGQISYNQRLRQQDVDEDARMITKMKEADDEYKRKVEYFREKPDTAKMHPLRRGLYYAAQNA